MTKAFFYCSYADARRGTAFLSEGLGFTQVRAQWRDESYLIHSEWRLDDVVVIAASNDAPYEIPPVMGRSTGFGIYLLTSDVDGAYRRAIDAGAQSLFAPEDTEWKTRRARVRDPQGYEWSFGTYEPGATW